MRLFFVFLSAFFAGCNFFPATNQVASPSIANLVTIAANSACISYKWKDRGLAPRGYIKGMAIMMAKEVCQKNGAISGAMTKALGPIANDALALYGLQPTLVNLFSLGTGLGMRESSGCYTCGYDTSAGPETSIEAEAGLFQMSANAISQSSLVQPMLNAYTADGTKCLADIFQEGSSCKVQGVVGTGLGAAYQKLVKACPAAAVESTFIIMRILRKHWGPINRQETEVVKVCSDMFGQIEAFVNANPSVCGSL